MTFFILAGLLAGWLGWQAGARMASLLFPTRGPQRPTRFDLVFVQRDGLIYIEPKTARCPRPNTPIISMTNSMTTANAIAAAAKVGSPLVKATPRIGAKTFTAGHRTPLFGVVSATGKVQHDPPPHLHPALLARPRLQLHPQKRLAPGRPHHRETHMVMIGLHGKAGAGKDTVAEHLYRKHGFARISFAGPLKDMLVTFGISRHQLEGPAKEKVIDWLGKSPRQLMQTLGTEWGRQLIADDLWIRHAEHRLRTMQRISQKIVFTDVRFENEAAWLRGLGGNIWHIARKLPANVTPMHLSEAGLAIHPGDSFLPNHAAIDDLHDIVDEALIGGWTYEGQHA